MPPSAKPKPVFKTSIPFTETRWPQINSVDRDNILDLLCDLLQPLGDHRKTYIHPSKGKKRKRKSTTTHPSTNSSQDVLTQDTPPPPPEIKNHVLIGLNSITRHLEVLAAQNAPPNIAISINSNSPPPQPLSFILIPHNHPPSSLPHAPLPTLIHLSTISTAPDTATRLIAVPPSCESRLASALQIPHVGALGILEGAPGANALVEYVREHVGRTECTWIDEAMKGQWKGVKTDVTKT